MIKPVLKKICWLSLATILSVFPGILHSQGSGGIKNPDTIVFTTFKVDMSYMAAMGVFDPVADFVDLAGTMNGWAGSAHLAEEPNFVYSIDYELTPGGMYYYRFRINGDSATMEFPLGPLRVTRGPDFPVTLMHFYSDYDPAAVPMTFNCNLWYQIKAGHFNPLVDYLDVAGNFNGNGSYDILFPASLQDTIPPPDSIYTLTKLIDTSYINGPPLEFKFRFNSNWNTSELPGAAPYRTYDLLDTTGGLVNRYDCWYNNADPGVPSPPFAYDLGIQGVLAAGQVLTGTYVYEDINLDPEGISLYQWYWADDNQGNNLTAIPSADSINYVPTISEIGKYIAFEVTPVAATGDSVLGLPVKIYSAGPIGGVGINDITISGVMFYPDPVSDILYFGNLGNTQRIEIYNITGRKIGLIEPAKGSAAQFNVSGLAPGIYFLKFIESDNRISTAKFIRN